MRDHKLTQYDVAANGLEIEARVVDDFGVKWTGRDYGQEPRDGK